MKRGKASAIAVSVLAMALLMTACGDDDDGGAVASDDDTETTEEGTDVASEDEAFCAVAKELDEQEEFPSPEQLDEYAETAPDEISDAANTIVDAFKAAGDDPFSVFDDPEITKLLDEEIEPFEAEHCGLHGDDDEDEPEQDASVTEPDPSAAQVAVTAKEYAFAIDPAPAAGKTQLTMTNEGEERHVMVLFKLAEGATMDEVLESEGDEGIDGPEYESDTATSGETAVLTVDLTAGDYGMICYLPDAEGTPHLALGMVSEFSVS